MVLSISAYPHECKYRNGAPFLTAEAGRLLLDPCRCYRLFERMCPETAFLSVLLAASASREVTEPFGLRCSRSLSSTDDAVGI